MYDRHPLSTDDPTATRRRARPKAWYRFVRDIVRIASLALCLALAGPMEPGRPGGNRRQGLKGASYTAQPVPICRHPSLLSPDPPGPKCARNVRLVETGYARLLPLTMNRTALEGRCSIQLSYGRIRLFCRSGAVSHSDRAAAEAAQDGPGQARGAF